MAKQGKCSKAGKNSNSAQNKAYKALNKRMVNKIRKLTTYCYNHPGDYQAAKRLSELRKAK